MKLKVEGHDGFVKDSSNEAILNSDLDSLHAYRARRDALLKKDSDFSKLQNEVDELKELVQKLLAEKSK